MLQPVGERLLVKRVEKKENTTASGLVLPKEATMNQTILGEVIEVGESVKDVAVGDTVLVSIFAGTDVEYGDEKYIILKDYDVLALVE